MFISKIIIKFPIETLLDIIRIMTFVFTRTYYYSPVSARRRFDVHATSITLKRRRMDVKTTLCVYWVWIFLSRIASLNSCITKVEPYDLWIL